MKHIDHNERLIVIVGPSGAAGQRAASWAALRGEGDAAVHTARRVITRPVDDGAEQHEAVTAERYTQLLLTGASPPPGSERPRLRRAPREFEPLASGRRLVLNSRGPTCRRCDRSARMAVADHGLARVRGSASRRAGAKTLPPCRRAGARAATDRRRPHAGQRLIVAGCGAGLHVVEGAALGLSARVSVALRSRPKLPRDNRRLRCPDACFLLFTSTHRRLGLRPVVDVRRGAKAPSSRRSAHGARAGPRCPWPRDVA